MWVSSKKWNDLVARLRELEKWKERHEQDVVAGRNFTVFSETEKEWVSPMYSPSFQVSASQQIAVKDVVQRILEHLGLKLLYVSGQPKRVDLQTVKKKAA